MAVNAKLEKREGAVVSLFIEVPAADVQPALDKVVTNIQKKGSIKGFRPGKAPRDVIESRYKDVIQQQLFDEVIPTSLSEAMKALSLRMYPYSKPRILEINQLEDKAIKYHAEIEEMPTVKLGPFKNIPIHEDQYEVGDADLDKVLKSLQERNADLVAKSGDKADIVEEKDYVTIDVKGSKDGEAVSESDLTDYSVEVTDDRLPPGFKEGLIGMKKDESKDITVTYPEDYASEKLAGQTMTMATTVKEIRTRELPPIDDELAKDMGEFETIEDLKKNVRETLMAQAKGQIMKESTSELIQAIVAKTKFVIPPSMLDLMTADKMEMLQKDLHRRGMKIEQYYEQVGKDEEAVHNELQSVAETEIKERLVLDEVAHSQQIEATDDDVNAEISSLAQQYRMEPEQVRDQLTKGEMMSDIRHRIRINKTIDYLYTNAKIKKGKKRDVLELSAMSQMGQYM